MSWTLLLLVVAALAVAPAGADHGSIIAAAARDATRRLRAWLRR